MNTPSKATHRILNSSYTPFSSLASSKVSTNCDFEREESNSLSKKKFTRKRQGSNDSLKKFRMFETDKKPKRASNNETLQNIEQSFQKADELLKKFSFKKQSLFTSKYVKLPTDRSNYENELQYLNSSVIHTSRSRQTSRNKTQQSELMNSGIDYQGQLQMKNNQFMMLEDETNRLRKELKNKQTVTQKLEKQKQNLVIDYENKIKIVNEKLKKLQMGIVEKDQIIERSQKFILKQKQQIKRSENQIQMLKLHVDQLMKCKLSKNTLQIISYRQISLQNQIQDLKKQINFIKTDYVKELEKQLGEMKQKMIGIDNNNNSLAIANRVLVKKTQSVDGSLQKKHKCEVTQLKQKMKQVIKEGSLIKKENIILRKKIFEIEKKCQKQKQKEKEKDKYQNLLKDSINNNGKRVNRIWSNGKKNDVESNDQNLSDDTFSFSLSK